MKEDEEYFVVIASFIHALIKLDLATFDDKCHWSSYWLYKDKAGYQKMADKYLMKAFTNVRR